MRQKLNCWDFKSCGRQPGGKHEDDLGVCPAAVEMRLDGVHSGHYAGRTCWVVSGTLCGGSVQGTFAKKFKSCESCDFYQLVKREEDAHFNLSAILLTRLKSNDSDKASFLSVSGSADRQWRP